MNEFRQRSEEIIQIQNEIAVVEDGLTKLLNDYTDRGSGISNANRSFKGAMADLKTRTETLQKYAKLIMETEQKFSRERDQFLIEHQKQSKIMDIDISVLTDKYKQISDQYQHDARARARLTAQMDQLSAQMRESKIKEEENEEMLKSLVLSVFKDQHDDASDRNVAASLEIASLRSEIEEIDSDIATIQNQLLKQEKRLETLTQNQDMINYMKGALKRIPELEQKIEEVSETTKEVKRKQKEAIRTHTVSVSEFNQTMKCRDEYIKNRKAHKKFALDQIPSNNDKGNLMLGKIRARISDQEAENLVLKENETQLETEVSAIQSSIDALDDEMSSISEELSSFVIIPTPSSTETVEDLKRYKAKIRNAIVTESLLKMRDQAENNDDIYSVRQEVMMKHDDLVKQIMDTENDKKRLHMQIESSYWQLNVLEAEFHRLTYDNSCIKTEIQSAPHTPLSKERKAKMEQRLQELTERVNEKVKSIAVRSDKLLQRKSVYDESMANWSRRSKSIETPTKKSSSLCNGSPVVKPAQASLLELYFSKVCESFESQSESWKDEEDAREFRSKLRSWGTEVDEANAKITSMRTNNVLIKRDDI